MAEHIREYWAIAYVDEADANAKLKKENQKLEAKIVMLEAEISRLEKLLERKKNLRKDWIEAIVREVYK